MPAKYLHALGEERRPELHRQVGCVTGILQAFDRRHSLAAHKRLLPPGPALSSSPNVGGNCARYSPQIVLENNFSKTWAENHRAPAPELSKTSYSSSPSSSFSSLDGNMSTQQDLSSTDRMLFPERPFKSSLKLKSSFDSENGFDIPDGSITNPDNMPVAEACLPTLGIRNLVKDSIYKDSRDLSVRISTKDEVKGYPNGRDAPRQLDGPPSDCMQGKSKGLMDINESLRVLAKLREASWTPPESGYHARLSYDAPRFSYDGKEAASKLREVPRLSLDIKEGHLWNREMDSKPRMDVSSRSSSSIIEARQEQPACKRLPSVVAKLMGLENLPEHNEKAAALQAGKEVEESKHESMLSPLSITSHNEPSHRHKKIQESTRRNIPNSKFPVEAAPWKQQERIVLPRRLPKGSKGAQGREQTSVSFFSDIEKRLKDLDFHQSNKDFRALKQILDSMEAKGLLQNKKQEEASMIKSYDGSHDNKEIISAMGQNSKANPMWTAEENNTEISFRSPIVIMKPSKSSNLLSEVDPSGIPLRCPSELPQLDTGSIGDKRKTSLINRTAKEKNAQSSPRVLATQTLASYDRRSNGRNEDSSKQKHGSLLATDSSSRGQQLPRDNNIGLQKNRSSTSPRLLQKTLDSERRARPPIPSPESNKSQRRADRNNLDTVSPRSKFRRKPAHAREGDTGMPNGFNNRTRSLNHQGNDMSTKSDGSMSVASELDLEITSTDKSADVDISYFQQDIGTPSGRNPQKVKTLYEASKDVSSADPSAALSERPSPVSVLDSSFDQEDPFPTSNERHLSEDPWKRSDTQPSHRSMQSKSSKLANVASLLEKLQKLSVNKDEDAPPVDHIAFLCETESPDQRYLSEILLASGLLMKDLGSEQTGLQLHSSGYPINPDLFLVLEQRKVGRVSKPEGIHQSRNNIKKSDPSRAHRKLIFDAVNELLFHNFEKETTVYSLRSFTRIKDLTVQALNGQQMVKFLSSGINDLEVEQSRICQDSSVIPDAEILHKLQGWTSFSRELPGIVLEIERSIFKEMVDEVVRGESADGPQMKLSGRRQRQLFA